MSNPATFAARQRAAEGQWFNTEGQRAVLRHLEKMVEQGKVDRSVLEAAKQAQQQAPAVQQAGAGSFAAAPPTEVIHRRNEYVYEHKPGVVPTPRYDDKRYMQLGTNVSLGRARWSIDDASIFSVSDGKRLASTPPKAATAYEAARMDKIRRAALQTPTVAGYRVLPEMTPGRALLWGTILAIWGTGALVAATARHLDIHNAEEAPSRLRLVFEPLAASLESWLAPLRGRLSLGVSAARDDASAVQHSELVRRLRDSMAATGNSA